MASAAVDRILICTQTHHNDELRIPLYLAGVLDTDTDSRIAIQLTATWYCLFHGSVMPPYIATSCRKRNCYTEIGMAQRGHTQHQ